VVGPGAAARFCWSAALGVGEIVLMRKVASLLAVVAYGALSCSVFAGEWVTLSAMRAVSISSSRPANSGGGDPAQGA
jgi:hypothetical protein